MRLPPNAPDSCSWQGDHNIAVFSRFKHSGRGGNNHLAQTAIGTFDMTLSSNTSFQIIFGNGLLTALQFKHFTRYFYIRNSVTVATWRRSTLQLQLKKGESKEAAKRKELTLRYVVVGVRISILPSFSASLFLQKSSRIKPLTTKALPTVNSTVVKKAERWNWWNLWVAYR